MTLTAVYYRERIRINTAPRMRCWEGEHPGRVLSTKLPLASAHCTLSVRTSSNVHGVLAIKKMCPSTTVQVFSSLRYTGMTAHMAELSL